VRQLACQIEAAAGLQMAGLLAHCQPHLALHHQRLDGKWMGVRFGHAVCWPEALGDFVEAFGEAGAALGVEAAPGHRGSPATVWLL